MSQPTGSTVCSGTCGRTLGAIGKFLAHEDRYYCEGCYAAAFCEKCDKCGKPITDKVMLFFNKKWHASCFCCSTCGTNLMGKRYFKDGSVPKCNSCYGGIVRN